MADKDKFFITLKVAGKSYPRIGIARHEEEIYRRASNEVNSLINTFKSSFRADEEVDYLAMSALQLAVNNVKLEMQGSLNSEQEKLQQLDRQLDAYLNEI